MNEKNIRSLSQNTRIMTLTQVMIPANILRNDETNGLPFELEYKTNNDYYS